MSILRGLAVFLISMLFTFSVFMTITSYTLGDLILKENLKTFIKSELSPSLLGQECENHCLSFTGEKKQACIQLCLSELGNRTEETINTAVDEVYGKEFYGIDNQYICPIWITQIEKGQEKAIHKITTDDILQALKD